MRMPGGMRSEDGIWEGSPGGGMSSGSGSCLVDVKHRLLKRPFRNSSTELVDVGPLTAQY